MKRKNRNEQLEERLRHFFRDVSTWRELCSKPIVVPEYLRELCRQNAIKVVPKRIVKSL